MPPLIITLGSAGAKSYGYSLGTPIYTFDGGNQSWDSLLTMTRYMAGSTTTNASPTTGGTLTINGQSLGSYDYRILGTKGTTTTVSSFTVADWFNATADTRSMIIVVRGNLTVNSGITFTPSVRKLFACIYVAGTLTNNGSIVMNQRGANHSGTGTSGGLTTEAAIRIATGTFSAVSSPQIPSLGGAGGPRSGNPGATGSAGTAGGTGGGGAGAGNSGSGGEGAQGTSFTGGSGGGGASDGRTAGNAVARRGQGGAAASGGNWTGGGGGNPHGANIGNTGCGIVGTGGSLIVMCKTLAGSGAFQAIGGQGCASGGSGPDGAGGGTGGGSVNILTTTNSSTVTTSAAGGAAVAGGGGVGGAGGAGTARILTGSGI